MVGTPRTLHVGERIRYQGRIHEVIRVSDCSATIHPLEPEVVTVKDKQIRRKGHDVTISAWSEVEHV